MYTVDDFIAMFQNGISPEDIIEEFTTTLNEALEVKDERIRRSKQETGMVKILDEIIKYLNEFYPDLVGPNYRFQYSPEDVFALVDYFDGFASLYEKQETKAFYQAISQFLLNHDLITEKEEG